MEHRFEYLTSPQIGEAVKRRPLLVLGIGTIEEHGAHLPTGTDLFITQRFMDDLADRLKAETDWPFLMLPAIWTGYSGAEMQRWPGTIRMRTRTVMDMMREIVGSLCEMGFDKILILNGHGHHTELLRVVAREIADDHGVYCAVSNFLYLGAAEYNAVRSGGPGTSIHGGEDETAVMLHYGYEIDRALYTAVDHVEHHTPYFAGDNFIGSTKVFWSTWHVHKSRTGLLGDPAPATAESGRVLIDACVKHLLAFIQDYMTHDPARPASADAPRP
ncbi:MAG TPA: creatininase family protein [Chthonomonadaceae bacterium]|nr:creatininase family protein [Chthonomonadaceae bacterium]